MLNDIKQNKLKIVVSVVIVLGFGLIRAFEDHLFYDPFLAYYKYDFKNLNFPEFNGAKLFLGLFFRYFLNTVLSLLLIYVLFLDREILKFTAILYGALFVILFGMFFIILEYFPSANWLLFYVRRFIIQPIFVLLFIPAYYYQLQNFKK